uniref:Uncharacterized protein n=1 Tax=Cannabis sativa TaxID=3483 RepID=A0A803QRT1_CANSA
MTPTTQTPFKPSPPHHRGPHHTLTKTLSVPDLSALYLSNQNPHGSFELRRGVSAERERGARVIVPVQGGPSMPDGGKWFGCGAWNGLGGAGEEMPRFKLYAESGGEREKLEASGLVHLVGPGPRWSG